MLGPHRRSLIFISGRKYLLCSYVDLLRVQASLEAQAQLHSQLPYEL